MSEQVQVKSKERVSEHGEVFTNDREVNAMLDLVKAETERIDSRFLEPACGEGAFLKEILRRKLEVVERNYKKSPHDFERYSMIALMSIYGVDIMEDNTEICRQNLFEIWNAEYTRHMKNEASDECRETARFILKKNILCGDALTLLQNNGEPITFAEWSFVTGDLVKRRDFHLDTLLAANQKQKTLFDMVYDEELKEFVPEPVAEFEPKDYRRLKEDE